MRWIAAARERLRALFFGARLDAEMNEELRFNLEKETELLREAGLSSREAQQQAHLRFGGVERFKEEVRDARGVRALEALGKDLRYGLRLMRRRPQVTVTVVLLIGAGLFIRSLSNGLGLDTGVTSRHVAIATISPSLGRYYRRTNARGHRPSGRASHRSSWHRVGRCLLDGAALEWCGRILR